MVYNTHKLYLLRQQCNIHNIRLVALWSYVVYCVTDAKGGVTYIVNIALLIAI